MKTIKLEELKGMAYIIAKAMLEKHKEYFCIINGEKVRVIA